MKRAERKVKPNIFLRRKKMRSSTKSGIPGKTEYFARVFFWILFSRADTRRNEISIHMYKCILVTTACVTLIGLPHHIFLVNTAILLLEENQYTAHIKKCITALKRHRNMMFIQHAKIRISRYLD